MERPSALLSSAGSHATPLNTIPGTDSPSISDNINDAKPTHLAHNLITSSSSIQLSPKSGRLRDGNIADIATSQDSEELIPTSYFLESDDASEDEPSNTATPSFTRATNENTKANSRITSNPYSESDNLSDVSSNLAQTSPRFLNVESRFTNGTKSAPFAATFSPTKVSNDGTFSINSPSFSNHSKPVTLKSAPGDYEVIHNILLQKGHVSNNGVHDDTFISLPKLATDLSSKSSKTGRPSPDTASQWDSSIPALQYSNSLIEYKDQIEDNDRQRLQETLLRNNSFARTQPDLELIKVSLSRSRSAYSKNQPVSETPPLLFSQDRSSIKRSYSSRKEHRADNDTGKSIYGGFDPVDHQVLANDDGGSEPDTKSKPISANSDEDTNSDDTIPGGAKFNPYTQETELNALKSAGYKAKRRFFSFSPPIGMFYKAENPDLNKSAENASKHFWSKASSGFTSKIKKVTSNKREYIAIWILFVLLMAAVCTMVPLIIIYSRGTDSTVKRYLGNISPQHRQSLLSDYIEVQKINYPMRELLNQNSTTGYEEQGLAEITPNFDSSIAGISSFYNIPLKYQKNKEIISVMNNTQLRNVFYGVDYAPRDVIYPMCGATLHDVMLDVALLSQVTSRIRTYGTQCNQARFILDSIMALNLNVSLAVGVWIGPNEDVNEQQLSELRSILRSYPRKFFESVYVGNEVLFREDQTADRLAAYITEVKNFVRKDLGWDLPVGTSEIGSKVDKLIMEASDVFGSNTHPFFNGDRVQDATSWIRDFVKFQIEPIREDTTSKPEIVISEIGWPYSGGRYNNAVSGKRQMQYFLTNWICASKDVTYPWFYFEAFDEPWKEVYHQGDSKWETEWGIFTKDRKLKEGITFPTC